MQSSTSIGSIGFSNNYGLLCLREWGAFPTNGIQTISNSTEIGTASPKITQQNLNFPLFVHIGRSPPPGYNDLGGSPGTVWDARHIPQGPLAPVPPGLQTHSEADPRPG